MKNAATKRVTISSIIARADFRDGMADYYACRPIKDQWGKHWYVAHRQAPVGL